MTDSRREEREVGRLRDALSDLDCLLEDFYDPMFGRLRCESLLIWELGNMLNKYKLGIVRKPTKSR